MAPVPGTGPAYTFDAAAMRAVARSSAPWAVTSAARLPGELIGGRVFTARARTASPPCGWPWMLLAFTITGGGAQMTLDALWPLY